MKIKLLLILTIAGLALYCPPDAFAYAPSCEEKGTEGSLDCAQYTWDDSLGGFTCPAGSKCNCFTNGSGTTQYNCICSGCSNCTTGAWVNIGTGYQRQQVANCECNTCNKYYRYRCAAGYYGSSSNGTSGCTQCPTWSGVYTTSSKTTLVRGTSAAGATAITGCYVRSGTYYDTTGTFKIGSNCQYK